MLLQFLDISNFSSLNCTKYRMTRHLVINKKEFSSNRSLIYQNVGEIMLIYWISKRGKVFFKKRVAIAHFSRVFALKLTQFLRVCKDVDREQHNMDQPWRTKNLITNQRRSIISFLVGTQQEYLALLSLHTDWIGRV